MKLTKLETFIVEVPPPGYGGNYWFFIKLHTDEGIYGIGETATLGVFYRMQKSYVTLMEEIFESHLKGQDPMNRERLSKTVYSALSCRHTEYLTQGLVSAIDVALWDIAGKASNQPVYNLLGGVFRDRIRSYTYIYNIKTGGEVRSDWFDSKWIAENAAYLVEEGFTGVKLDPVPMSYIEPPLPPEEQAAMGYGGAYRNPFNMTLEHYAKVEETIGALRDAVGTRADILIGTHGQMTTASAIRLAKVLEPFDPLWFEEPVPPENTKEMAKVARSTFIPIATGERLSTVFDFTRLLEDGAAVYLQPDLGSCGGISECKKIAAVAEGYYAQMAPHVWGGPVITAAAIQIAASIPNFLIMESIYKGGGYFSEIVTEPFVWEKGYYHLPKSPGIGIDLNMKVVEKYKVTSK
ncbi:MAG: mandelate racemase/muconate lactonizing enzyme family protein [Dehalococcoidales bacterium]|nr:mandelate racemase/muconate lactonizing enzyme family protein [Dehalococcoidales bacterium]